MSPQSAPAPIGVYDSGFGGLSVLQALEARLPHEAFVYVADSGHAPYGDRAPDFVESRARAVARFLVGRGAKALVLACNTASVVAARHLRAEFALPVVAMEPAIKPAAQLTESGVVLVLATTNTIRSESVARLCRSHGAGKRLLLQPCPGLADQVERGEFRGPATRALLERYLLPGLEAGADTIVLGCTHYAFLAAEIAALAGPAVHLVEPSEAVARQLARVLGAPARAPRVQRAPATFFSSGPNESMAHFLASIGEPFERVLALDAPADTAPGPAPSPG
ncbi:MAG: glutamate racemase [Burkholderiales bacterium]|nr:glutamate racemase [Burkholderiales bacterium]MDE2455080.1 glutamate racemase [Burkholderiales bacterium]